MADVRNPDGTFAKGSNGGPGRPKSVRRIEGILQRIGQQEATLLDGTKVTRLELLMEKVYSFAEAGQQWAVAFVAERTEGKIREAAPVIESDLVPTDGLVFTEEKQEANAG